MTDEQRNDDDSQSRGETRQPAGQAAADSVSPETSAHVQPEQQVDARVEAVAADAPAVEPEKEVKVVKAAAAPKRKPAADAKPAEEGDAPAEKPAPAPKAAAEGGAAPVKPAAKPAAAAAKKAPPPPDPRVEAAKAKADELQRTVAEALSADAVVEAGNAHFKPMLLIRKEDWARVVELLRTHPDYQLNYLECMAGTDYKDYIEISVFVQSTELGHFVCLKTRTDRENAEVPSLVSVHPGVNWEEREIYDLLGVHFTGHPDLRRIMMWDDFTGHPLRKDYSEWD